MKEVWEGQPCKRWTETFDDNTLTYVYMTYARGGAGRDLRGENNAFQTIMTARGLRLFNLFTFKILVITHRHIYGLAPRRQGSEACMADVLIISENRERKHGSPPHLGRPSTHGGWNVTPGPSSPVTCPDTHTHSPSIMTETVS